MTKAVAAALKGIPTFDESSRSASPSGAADARISSLVTAAGRAAYNAGQSADDIREAMDDVQRTDEIKWVRSELAKAKAERTKVGKALAGRASGCNGTWLYRDTVTTSADPDAPVSEVDVMVEQLREVIASNPDVSQNAAASQLGTTRDRVVFKQAWAIVAASPPRVCVRPTSRTHTHADTHGEGGQ